MASAATPTTERARTLRTNAWRHREVRWATYIALGLFIIAFHQYWRSPAAVIVSLVGWFFLIRGILLLTVPQAYDAAGDAVYSSGARTVIWVLFACLASAGLYLTYVGWKPERGATQADAAGS